MQREIKFRAWDNKQKLMLENVSVGTVRIWSKNIEAISADCIFMQFTGLLDKNGKKIFENDILKIYYEGNQRSYLKEVKWLNDAINKGRWDALDNCAFTSCEVVGNIFENPELLAEIINN
jgi:hypothetical protein